MSKQATISVNVDADLKARLDAMSLATGAAINTIARAAVLAAVEFYDRHGFITMPVKFETFDVVRRELADFQPKQIAALRAPDSRKKSNGG